MAPTTRIHRAINGDPDATEALVAALRPRLARMAAYYARCTGEDADDLLQEAWVGLLEALPNVDPRIGSPEQHLIQRARWRLLDAVKRARVRRCLPLDEEVAERLPGPSMETALALACVWEFTSQLKPVQQAVLGCLLSGLTWREAARALGCSAANIAYHVRQIQRRYESWNDDTGPVREDSRYGRREHRRRQPALSARHPAPVPAGGGAPLPLAGDPEPAGRGRWDDAY
jgi:RNA polymerase sigma factor (sigma-70 family)